MARIKQGNAFSHAKEGGIKVKLSAARKTAKKRAAPKKKAASKTVAKPVPRAAGYRYRIEVRRTKTGAWSPVGAGCNDAEAAKKLAAIYASNYPKYWFRVV